jgi:hypothetical protein
MILRISPARSAVPMRRSAVGVQPKKVSEARRKVAVACKSGIERDSREVAAAVKNGIKRVREALMQHIVVDRGANHLAKDVAQMEGR